MYAYIEVIGWGSAVIAVLFGIWMLWSLRDDEASEPDGVSSGPKCYGDYPIKYSYLLAERECFTCIYKNQCLDKTIGAPE